MFGNRFYALLNVLSSFAIILMGEKRACCFTLIVFLLSSDYSCSIAFPMSVIGYSAVLLWYILIKHTSLSVCCRIKKCFTKFIISIALS